MTTKLSNCCVWTPFENGRPQLRVEIGDAEVIFKFDTQADLIDALHELQEQTRLALEVFGSN